MKITGDHVANIDGFGHHAMGTVEVIYFIDGKITLGIQAIQSNTEEEEKKQMLHNYRY